MKLIRDEEKDGFEIVTEDERRRGIYGIDYGGIGISYNVERISILDLMMSGLKDDMKYCERFAE
jgi:hypothetical protein